MEVLESLSTDHKQNKKLPEQSFKKNNMVLFYLKPGIFFHNVTLFFLSLYHIKKLRSGSIHTRFLTNPIHSKAFP